MLYPSKVQELVGNLCQETGVKIGKITTTLMAKASHLRSQPVMVGLLSPIMLPLLVGPLDKPTLVPSSAETNSTAPAPALSLSTK